jgi:hypothetical protein
LRIEKYSPLKEVVESTPGYYYKRIGGPVYSDKYGRKELKRIRNRIRREFYSPAQLLHIARKGRRIGLVTGRDVVHMTLRLPLLVGELLKRRRRKSKARALRASSRDQ